ncbi:hypothetical protein PWT90_02015 [Aphanocladium album]|nr:hypothetical protein PWT90_02015 [Aphanocladium album]
MSGTTGPIRSSAWNVRLTLGNLFAPKQFAGVYQHPGEHENGRTFADVCAELDLCFELPGGHGQSQSQGQRPGQHPDTSNDVNSWTGVAFGLTEAPSDYENQRPSGGISGLCDPRPSRYHRTRRGIPGYA